MLGKNAVMANGRRASIHDHHAVGGSVEDKAEMLRDSLSQLRDSLSAASGELDPSGCGGIWHGILEWGRLGGGLEWR